MGISSNLYAIDIETTGLNVDKCVILEFGAVHVASGAVFRRVLLWEGAIGGELYALGLNARLLEEIKVELDRLKREEVAPSGLYCRSEMLLGAFSDWVREISGDYLGRIEVLGKNYGAFDLQFLKRLKRLNPEAIWPYRSVDIGSICWMKKGCIGRIPGMDECLRLAGIAGRAKHTAIDDCQDYIKILEWANGY